VETRSGFSADPANDRPRNTGQQNGPMMYIGPVIAVENVRVEGKLTQRHTAYLGGTTESAIRILHRRYGFLPADLSRLVLHRRAELNPPVNYSVSPRMSWRMPGQAGTTLPDLQEIPVRAKRPNGGTMGSNGVVSIRVEALGVSITIADGNIAIEQTSTTNPTAGVSAAGTARPSSARQIPARAAQPTTEQTLPVSEEGDSASDAGSASIDEVEQTPDRPSSPGRNGVTEHPGEAKPARASSGSPVGADSDTAVPAGQTKPLWSDEEVDKLRALYPTHSASAIAKQLGRGRNAVRSKAQNLGLRKDGQPTVVVKSPPREAKPTPKPRSLSAAVTAESTPGPAVQGQETHGWGGVSLFDHHPSQCRWIVSDVWPVMYCGAPVVDCSSWCGYHSRRVFSLRPHGLGASPYRISKRFR
jgi:hypothetical protein